MRLKNPVRIVKRAGRFIRPIASGKFNFGHCAICSAGTLFIESGDDLRECYVCFHCLSIPRWRALFAKLEDLFPNWRELKILESSPAGACSKRIASECPGYVPTHFFPNVPTGTLHDGVRCEDLERLTFADESFDVVLTQEVMEHLFDPQAAFAEIARVLKPGGVHLFTVPYLNNAPTVVRAQRRGSQVQHILEPAYHGNPIDDNGSLVVTDWGSDIREQIFQASGLQTQIVDETNRRKGIAGRSPEVFISRKPEQSA